ncbi:MAG: hypothetical protein JW772_05185, partial [Candidatus Diapherotrites archaeon]|nr:hypothetical protein [Candidatus Diapherotrites archaeon]
MLNQFYDKFIFTNGLKFKHNNFFLINVPFLIAPIPVLSGIMSVEDPEFTKKLYYAVKDSVRRDLLKQISSDFGFKGERMAKFMGDFFAASGWGSIKVVDLDSSKTEAIVSVQDNPFASHVRKPVKAPVDHFLRGILAGIFSRAFNQGVDCVEVHCCCLGSRDCEFIIKPAPNFDVGNS